jgi:ABC-type spermidine/putrescine transport system permease subunit II
MRRGTTGAWIVVGLVCLFMAAPLVIIVINSFNGSSVSQFPPTEWSLKWFRAAWANRAFRDGFTLSVRVATASAVLATLAGLGAAYVFSRRQFRGVAVVQSLINAPLSMPKIAVGLAGLIAYISVTSWVTSVQTVLHGSTALAFMHAAMSLPLVVGVLTSSLEASDRRLEAAARDLGLGPIPAFARVVLPLLGPALLVAFAFSFMVSFDELESSLFMASLSGNTLPVAMFVFLETHLDPTLAALSTLLLGATVLLVCLGLALTTAINRRTKGRQR